MVLLARQYYGLQPFGSDVIFYASTLLADLAQEIMDMTFIGYQPYKIHGEEWELPTYSLGKIENSYAKGFLLATTMQMAGGELI